MSDDSIPGDVGGAGLMDLLRGELASVPVAQWGFFFPCHVAVWRYIESRRPGVLGALKAYFKDEPSFEGKGAKWFCEDLGSNDEYLTVLESIMYPITRDASPALRETVGRRGFFYDQEIPPIDPALVERLARVVLTAVDHAASRGQIR